MPREKPAYRDNIAAMKEFLEQKYGDNRHMMSITDISEYTGKCYRSIKKYYGVPREGVTIETLARALS